MVALAKEGASAHPGMVDVEQRGWEDIDEVDAYDAAVALGVFDYVGEPEKLLARMGRAAPNAIASFPYPGLRTNLRKVRYGMRGVGVHGYPSTRLRRPGRGIGHAGGAHHAARQGRCRRPLHPGRAGLRPFLLIIRVGHRSRSAPFTGTHRWGPDSGM